MSPCSSPHYTGFQSKLPSTTRPWYLPTEQLEELPLPTFRLCSNPTPEPEYYVLPPLVSWPFHPYGRAAPAQPSPSLSLSWHSNGGTSFPLKLRAAGGDGWIRVYHQRNERYTRPVLWSGIDLQVAGPSWSGEVCHSIIGLSLLSLQAISTLCVTGKTFSPLMWYPSCRLILT
uniref:Uncharacterized protein n=1 Tax=Oncorhynchus tshawytscha TaxID=74940 RepID=A0AAZ3RTY0_ONCTS